MARLCSNMIKEVLGCKRPPKTGLFVGKEFTMCTSSSSQRKVPPAPALSKEQLAEVEYLIQLEKVKHDKAMDDKLVAHGKWLDNKTNKWLTCFQEVWVEAAYNKAVLFEEMKKEVTNKKLGTLPYAAALFVGGVGAAASVAKWLFE